MKRRKGQGGEVVKRERTSSSSFSLLPVRVGVESIDVCVRV
jgi:hypothetical protein